MNHLDFKGETPIFRAAKEKKLKAFQTLVSLGADCTVTNSHGKSLLQIAKKNRMTHMIALINGQTQTV